MKATEVIDRLIELVKAHGDLEVIHYDADYGMGPLPVEHIKLEEEGFDVTADAPKPPTPPQPEPPTPRRAPVRLPPPYQN